MIASPKLIEAPPAPDATRRRAGLTRGRAGFTLTELLVVIALIVLLVSVLLAALAGVQRKAKRTQTEATIQAFVNGCDTFHQEHGFYPGVVPEDILANNTDINFTAMENALLHLMGGAIREEDVGQVAFDAAIGTEISFQRPGGGTYRIKVNLSQLGNGPVINGKPYGAYFTPSGPELGALEQTVVISGAPTLDEFGIPDLSDAWGNPIVYLRRARTIGPLVAGDGSLAQFDLRSIYQFVNQPGLGRLDDGSSYAPNSLLWFDGGTVNPATGNLARILEHPSLPQQARGAYMVLSAGPDGTLFSIQDGPGESTAPVSDISDPADYPARVVQEYDDVLRFGGS